jgi:hypothetical protein
MVPGSTIHLEWLPDFRMLPSKGGRRFFQKIFNHLRDNCAISQKTFQFWPLRKLKSRDDAILSKDHLCRQEAPGA